MGQKVNPIGLRLKLGILIGTQIEILVNFFTKILKLKLILNQK
jgi:hypothetical protein